MHFFIILMDGKLQAGDPHSEGRRPIFVVRKVWGELLNILQRYMLQLVLSLQPSYL